MVASLEQNLPSAAQIAKIAPLKTSNSSLKVTGVEQQNQDAVTIGAYFG